MRQLLGLSQPLDPLWLNAAFSEDQIIGKASISELIAIK